MKSEARPHQLTGKAMLRASIARGHKRPIVQMPTGAGKTWLAADIFESHFQRVPNGKVVFIVDAISLIDQTVRAFYNHGLYGIGVLQADHPMQDWSKPIQVASVQTLKRRGMPAGVTLVIVDEAHDQHEWLNEIMTSEEWAKVPFIGLSATPWSKGLGLIYDDLIIPVTMQELIDQGLLSPFRVYAAAHPDLTGVAIQHGDYAEGQLSGVMQDRALVADIVETWKRLGENRPTVAFCVDRAHAKKVQLRFEEAGVGCGYIDAFTDRLERNRIREQLDRAEIRVVANVGCLIKGVDWAIGCVILARPTRSEIRFVQMVGRGLRVNEGIPDCVILDHADNTLRLGFVTDIHHDQLCTAKRGERKVAERKVALPKECPSCAFLKPARVHECPACGFKPERRSNISEEDGELVEITRVKVRAAKHEKQRWYSSLQYIALQRGYSGGWVSHTYRKKFGIWPKGLDESSPVPPGREVHGFVQHCLIAHAKSRKVA
jgi:superfamily II DNA or RNA helicase